MSTFIQSSACRGHCPEGLVGRRQYSRPELIGRLVKNRDVARFIVAPDGFGKSATVAEYAQTMFGFHHVFLLNAKSPCFVRDLDAETLQSKLLDCDPQCSLVVVEDLPSFDSHRASLFSEFIDKVLASSIEVLVTCAPSCDAYADLQRDRIVVDSFALLLSDEECALSSKELLDSGFDLDALPIAERVVSLRWSNQGKSLIASGLRREQLPQDMTLALLSLLVLQRGTFADLEHFMEPKVVARLMPTLEKTYPYVGICGSEKSFSGFEMPVELLVKQFSGLIEDLSASSLTSDRESLICKWVQILMTTGRLERAAEVLKGFGSRDTIQVWLRIHGKELIVGNAIKPLYDLCQATSRRGMSLGNSIRCQCALSLAILGDAETALEYADRILKSPLCQREEAVLPLMLLGVLQPEQQDEEWFSQLQSIIWELEQEDLRQERPQTLASGAETVFLAPQALEFLAKLKLASHDDLPAALALWQETQRLIEDPLQARGLAEDRHQDQYQDQKQDRHQDQRQDQRQDRHQDQRQDQWKDKRQDLEDLRLALLLGGSELLVQAAQAPEKLVSDLAATQGSKNRESCGAFEDFEPSARLSLESIYQTLDRYLAKALQGANPVGWIECSFAQAMEMANGQWSDPWPSSLDSHGLHRLRLAEMDLKSQRDSYYQDRRKQEEIEAHRETCNPSLYVSLAKHRQLTKTGKALTTPTLHVKLFGGLSVRMGDRTISSKAFRRKKSKVLLALLVLNRGREFPRDELASLLWPENDLLSARKNFYCVWSELKRVLSIEGICPYLIRTHQGCSMDITYVESDVYQMEQLCREMLFEANGERSWESIYEQITTDFSQELLPGERDNRMILALRRRFRTQMVDALVASSARLLEQGETQGALWFAREAIRRDHSREDAYGVQMEAQISLGQRAAALESYFACRNYLAEELGIDPSARIVQLYRSIIDEEVSV